DAGVMEAKRAHTWPSGEPGKSQLRRADPNPVRSHGTHVVNIQERPFHDYLSRVGVIYECVARTLGDHRPAYVPRVCSSAHPHAVCAPVHTTFGWLARIANRAAGFHRASSRRLPEEIRCLRCPRCSRRPTWWSLFSPPLRPSIAVTLMPP